MMWSSDLTCFWRLRTQAKMVESAKAKGGKEIPVPKVTRVPSYNTDYLPTFREPNTYIRGRGRTFMMRSMRLCARHAGALPCALNSSIMRYNREGCICCFCAPFIAMQAGVLLAQAQAGLLPLLNPYGHLRRWHWLLGRALHRV